jgi:hypothetical protein
MLRPISILPLIASAGVALGGGVWAALPYAAYKLPPVADNWTSAYYGGLLRDRYPVHLLNPAWFIYGIRWPLAESCARFGVVLIVLAIIFIYARFIRHEKKSAA